jgi:hypothetical protein
MKEKKKGGGVDFGTKEKKRKEKKRKGMYRAVTRRKKRAEKTIKVTWVWCSFFLVTRGAVAVSLRGPSLPL